MTFAEAPRRWTAVDDARLRELWPTTNLADLATLFDRTPKAMSLRATKIGLSMAGRYGELRRAEMGEAVAPITVPVVTNGHVLIDRSDAREMPGWDEPGGLDALPPASLGLCDGQTICGVVEIVLPDSVPGPPSPDALDVALAMVARLARAGAGQVATLTAERDVLRAITEQQAGLIAAYQAALGGSGTHPDELRHVERERDLVGAECRRLDAELGEMQQAHRALTSQHNALLTECDQLRAQLAMGPPGASNGHAPDTGGYEAELRRCWLVIAWLRKAIDEGRACRLLGVPDAVGLMSQADRLAEVGRQAAESQAVAR